MSHDSPISVPVKSPRLWSALGHREFRALWLGMFASNAGSNMHKVATAWIIYQLTNSAAWLGADAFASAIPTVLLLPLGGVLVDRWNRKHLLIWANVICAAIAATLAVLQGMGLLHVWHILAASAASGVMQAAITPANTSLLPTLVGEDDVPNAIALSSLQFNLSRVLGPMLAGFALVWAGTAWTFALNALSFLVLCGALLLVGTLPTNGPAAQPLRAGFAEGLQFVRQRRDLTQFLVLVLVVALLGAPVISLVAPLVKVQLQQDVSGYTALVSCFGVGAMLAALASAALAKSKQRAIWIRMAPAVLGGCLVALAFNHAFWMATLLLTLAGFCFVGAMIQLGTEILQTTPDEMRGRVSSFQQICFRVAQPTGTALGGLLATQVGIAATFWSFGGLLMVCAALAVLRGAGRSPALPSYP